MQKENQTVSIEDILRKHLVGRKLLAYNYIDDTGDIVIRPFTQDPSLDPVSMDVVEITSVEIEATSDYVEVRLIFDDDEMVVVQNQKFEIT